MEKPFQEIDVLQIDLSPNSVALYRRMRGHLARSVIYYLGNECADCGRPPRLISDLRGGEDHECGCEGGDWFSPLETEISRVEESGSAKAKRDVTAVRWAVELDINIELRLSGAVGLWVYGVGIEGNWLSVHRDLDDHEMYVAKKYLEGEYN